MNGFGNYSGGFGENQFSGADFMGKWKEGQQRKNRTLSKKAVIIIIALLAVITLFTSTFSYLFEYLQIKEIGENFLSVFWKDIYYEVATQAVSFVVFFAIIFFNLRALSKNALPNLKDKSFLGKRWFSSLVSIFLSYYLSGMLSQDLYKSVLLALNGESFNIDDPIFSQDIGYYVFSRPFFVSVIGSFKTIFLLSTIICAIAYYLTLVKNTGRSVKDILKEEKGALWHIIINLLIYFVLVVFSYKFTAEGLLYSTFGRDNIMGVGFVEKNVWLIYYKVAPFVFIAAVIFAVLSLFKKKYITALVFVLLLPALYITTGLISFGVQEIFVNPNERNVQKEYIAYNLEATKRAYDISDVDEIEYSVSTDLTIDDVENEKAAIDNIRITDFNATLTAYNQIQYLRKYYSFNDVDIVPYNIDGKLTALSIAAREMNKENIDEAANSYANKTFRYTHGFGAVVSPVNRVTQEGQPEFMIKDIPPKSTGEIPNITEPRIYYGELTNDYVIVGPNNRELDYSEGVENYENSYNGLGGDELTLGKRLLYSLYLKDFKMLVSGNIDAKSKILINRNILERVKLAAPFLIYDDDPYMVIDDEGRLKWAIDAYTYSSYYPYSQRLEGINYLRNSVKVIVDAYDGDLKFYQIDKEDPVINTYRKIYPDVFETEPMPQSIKEHIRVPEYMFHAQTEIYGMYHVNTPEQFYDKDDVWQIANEKYVNNEVKVLPYFTVENLGDGDELVLVQPYVLEGRHNMVGLLMMRTNSEHYGELVLYRMPKNRTIYGPMQIENKIDNDPDISREMTLWSSGGSSVIRGNLIVVPFKDSLIYVEPVYITSQNNASLPELKRVVVAYNNEVAMEPTIEESMKKLFTQSAGTNEDAEVQGESVPLNPPTENEIAEASETVKKAVSAYEAFKSASSQNDWEAMGRYLDELDGLMNELKNQ